MVTREYTINFGNKEEAARTTLNMHRDTLISCRGRSPHPEELEWEIRLYEFMLEDPAKRLAEYQDVRHGKMMTPDDWHPPKPKREVAKILGWDVK